MGKYDKLMQKILQGRSDANISFEDLTGLMLHLGFEKRTKGSHHIFRKQGIIEKPNLQKSGNKAKPYQVRQIRDIYPQENGFPHWHRLGINHFKEYIPREWVIPISDRYNIKI